MADAARTPSDRGVAPRAERSEIALLCEVRQGSRPWKVARLEQISATGFRISLYPGSRSEVPLRIRIPGLRMLSAQIRWKDGDAVGCEFVEPLHVAVLDHIVRQARAG